MLPTIHLGPLAIQAPGLFLLVSVWLGLTLAERRADWHGIKSDVLDNLLFAMLVGFALGGRLAFVLENIRAISPLDIVSLNYKMFDTFGGFAAAVIVGLVFGSRKGLSFWSTLDALTPFLATVAVGIGAAHFAEGSAFGKETTLPWGIELWGAKRHPSQVYEVAAALFILSLVGLRKPFAQAGQQFLAFAALTAGASLFLEAFRGDSVLVFGGLRQGQIIAWLALAAALIGMEALRARQPESRSENVSNG